MWDNKINYNRSFNEDIFLIKFMDFFLNDGISINTFNKKKYDINKHFFYTKYDLPNKNLNYLILKKLFFKKNKLKIYTSKLWVLKFQKWIILYCFFYSLKFNRLKKVEIKKYKKTIFNSNLSTAYSIFLKSLINYNTSFNFFKLNNNKNIF